MTEQALADVLDSAAADLHRQTEPVSSESAVLAYRAGRRRRLRRRVWSGAMAVVAAVGIAAVSVTVQEKSTGLAGPAGQWASTLQPAYAVSYPASQLNRGDPRPTGVPSVPGPPDGLIVQVVPPFQELHVGVYISADGQLCSGYVQGPGRGGKSCPNELRPGWSGIYLKSQEAPLSVSYGHVPSTTVGLYRETGDKEPSPVPLYKGPPGFEHLNFFIDPPGRATGPETFLAYDIDGRLIAQRPAGHSQYRPSPGK